MLNIENLLPISSSVTTTVTARTNPVTAVVTIHNSATDSSNEKLIISSTGFTVNTLKLRFVLWTYSASCLITEFRKHSDYRKRNYMFLAQKNQKPSQQSACKVQFLIAEYSQ